MVIVGPVDDAVVGRLLDALKDYDGAVEVESPERVILVFSFDAGDLPGMASGLVAAMPRLLSIGRSTLLASRMQAEVVGLSVERVGDS